MTSPTSQSDWLAALYRALCDIPNTRLPLRYEGDPEDTYDLLGRYEEWKRGNGQT